MRRAANRYSVWTAASVPAMPPETRPYRLRLESFASWPDFDLAAEGWYYDAARHLLWVRFATQDTAARLTYATLP